MDRRIQRVRKFTASTLTIFLIFAAFSAINAAPASADAAADANRPTGFANSSSGIAAWRGPDTRGRCAAQDETTVSVCVGDAGELRWSPCDVSRDGFSQPVCLNDNGKLVVKDVLVACTRLQDNGMRNFCSLPSNFTTIPDKPPVCDGTGLNTSNHLAVCTDKSDPNTVKYACPSERPALAQFMKNLFFFEVIRGLAACPTSSRSLQEYQQNVLHRYLGGGAAAQAPGISSLAQSESLSKLTNGLGWFALLMCLLGVLISCSFWAIGYKGQNAGTELNGKKGLIVCLTAAFFIGASPALVNWLNDAASLPDVDRSGVSAAPVARPASTSTNSGIELDAHGVQIIRDANGQIVTVLYMCTPRPGGPYVGNTQFTSPFPAAGADCYALPPGSTGSAKRDGTDGP